MEPDDAERTRTSSSHLPIALTAALALVFVGVLAGSASAQNTTQVTLEAREDCPEKTFCFEVVGSLDDVEPGDVLDLTLESAEDNLQEHNVHIADRADANVGEEEQTPTNRAFASTEDVSPGDSASVSAEIPDNAEAIYLWCSIRAHEQQGMFLELELAGVEDEQETNGSPGVGVLAGIAVLAAAALGRRRA